jgi:hypothetical protein
VSRHPGVEARPEWLVMGLGARLLEQFLGDVQDDEQVWADERRLLGDGIGMQVGDVAWIRDELHER